MVGNRPTMTNSVVPMAKALRVSASKAMGMAATPVGRFDGVQCRGLGRAEKYRDGHLIFAFRSNIEQRLWTCRSERARDGR